MSDNFYGKDYGDYFLKLEKELHQKDKPSDKPQIKEYGNNTDNRKRTVGKRLYIPAALFVICVAVVITLSVGFSGKGADKISPEETEVDNNVTVKAEQEPELFAEYSDETAALSSDISSKNVIVIDLEQNKVIAEKNSQTRSYPASTTKIMTLLVAAENITDFNDTFKMTYEITDPLFKEGATVAGFSSGEVIGMTDLLYGTILPSGGDASIALAQKISGSEEKFVELMNEKAEKLGLKNTNFVNCTGLFDPKHYTTAEDMAVILRAAMKNSLCKGILSTYQYTTASTPQHPEGLPLTSTLFSYMYGTEPETAEITGGKTGFVNESGYCIASFGVGNSGKEYICVAFGGESRWPAVNDQINIYSRYAK